MFYEAIAIKNLLKCQHCNHDLYGEPRILPCCFNTVCMKCFHLIDKQETKFKCFLCTTESHLSEVSINHLAKKLITNNQSVETFYEKSFIHSLLKCDYCKKMFTEYEEPKILLCCYNTLCDNCVSKSTMSLCLCCHKDISNINNAFVVNSLATKLMTIQPVELLRGEVSKRFKKNLTYLENSTVKLSFEIQNGEFLIKEHCNEQRRLIQLSTEQRVQHIYAISDTLLKRVNEYEQECFKRYESCNQFKHNATELAKQTEHFIEKQNAYLNQLKINDQEILNLNEKLKEFKSKIENELLSVQTLLFSDEMLEFEMKKSVETTTLGYFKWKRINSDMKNLLSCSENIKLWDLKTNECLRTFTGHSSHVTCVKPLYNNRLISSSDDCSIKVWDIPTGKCLKTLLGHLAAVDFIEILSDDQIASCSLDKTIRIWSLESAKSLKVLEGHSRSIWRIKTLPNDMNQLLSASSDQSIKLWNINQGECVRTFLGHNNSVLCIEYLSENKFISGSTDKTIKVWDTSSGECLHTLEGHTRGVWCIQVMSNDQVLSGSFDNTIKLWSLTTNSCLKTLMGHSGCVNSIRKISQNQLASCSYDKTIKIWDLTTGECSHSIQAHTVSIYFIEAF